GQAGQGCTVPRRSGVVGTLPPPRIALGSLRRRVVDRRSQLEALGLSPALVRLATQKYPHPAFEFPCEEPYRCYSVPAEYWPADFTPLWECCEEVVGCRGTAEGVEFLAWDLETLGQPERLARSEQGLFFWLFSYLIEYEEWDDEAAALGRLREASAAIGFMNFDRLWAFMLQHGQRLDYREFVRAEAWSITA